MQLVNIVTIIAALIAVLPLIDTPACLVSLAYITYIAFRPKSSSKITHSTLREEEFYDDLTKIISDEKENEIISAWENVTKHTTDLALIKSGLPKSIFSLSSFLTQYLYLDNQKYDYLVLIISIIISFFSIFTTHDQSFCLTYSLLNVVLHQTVSEEKRIIEINVTNWESRNKFIKTITTYYKSHYETQVQKWISVQIQICNAEQKIIPAIFIYLKIHPDKIAVRNGIKCEKHNSISELIEKNDCHLFSQNYDAVIVRTHEDQSIYTSNGYIEIPNLNVNLDLLGGDFVGKISRTFLKILATDGKIRIYDQCNGRTMRCQSEIIRIASEFNLN